jgi:RNA polymerase sigma-70 factor (ECF subfamily)
MSLGLLNDLADAEEVVQDSFVYALRNLARFDARKSAFSTWLYTIALSRCRNKRRRKWLASFSLDLLDDVAQRSTQRGVEALLERRGVSRRIWEALQVLPPALQEAVVLRYLAGLRYREIGEAAGCNPKTAESRVRLGVAAMRRTLRQWGVADEMEWVELPAW